MKFYGITGTNGKTTTAWIFAEFVNAVPGRKCGMITTVEVDDGARHFYTGYTTPPLKQLHEIYAAMESNGCTDCVMEVSSHAIHQNRTGDTVFSGGAFTNLSEDHLDYHKTMEEYFRVKASFAAKIAEQSNTGDAPYVVCLDGENGQKMYDAVCVHKLRVIPVTNGCGHNPPVPSPDYDISELKLVGDYNRSNVLVAAALAEAAGVPHDTIQKMIPTLRPRWGRLERVENPLVAATVYVDFAHTPDGLEKVLSAVRGLTSRLWVVFGAGGDRDPMKRPLMGAACTRLADRLVVTSDNPRSEEPEAIIEAILGGVRSEKPSLADDPEALVIEPDRAKAIAYALRHAAKGDVVVIAGKGHETTQEIKGVKYPFDDREIVRNFRGDRDAPLLSVVIPTRNEASNIANCIHSFDAVRDSVEIIVVDNSSADETKAIASSLGAVVLDKGPERSAQRNLGWRTAKADWIIFLDADMMLPPETLVEILAIASGGCDGGKCENDKPTRAYWIPEVRTGSGLRTRARNFERSFYDGTCIDALRLFHKTVLEKTGGYDEKLIAGPEDWELDIRVLETDANCLVLHHHLIHNEKNLTLRRTLGKKAYYTKSMSAYTAKWPNHPAVKKQLGLAYRYFGVFVENGKWRRLVRHPILAAVMYLERIAVGATYLIGRLVSG